MSNFTEFDGVDHKPIPALDQRQMPARRATDTNLEIIAHKTSRIAGEFTEFKTEMHKAIDRIERAMVYNHATLTESISRATAKADDATTNADAAHEAVKAAVKEAMASAFPAGDPDGHRRHHEAVIKQAEEQAALFKKMREALMQYGLLGFVGWAFYSLWNSFLQGPHK